MNSCVGGVKAGESRVSGEHDNDWQRARVEGAGASASAGQPRRRSDTRSHVRVEGGTDRV